MKRLHQAAAALLSCVLAMQSMPLNGTVQAADSAEPGKEILVTGFEDKAVSMFSKRGDDDTSVITASDEKPHSGDYCMAIKERSDGWNGPSISLESLGCKPGVRYIASAWVKAQWYNDCKISLQYTDADGEQHYNNMSSAISQGEWVEIPAVKFSFSSDMKDVQLYIESTDKVELYVDDFSLTEGPTYHIQKDIPSLKEVYGDYFKIGTAVTAAELAPDATKDLILKHFNSVTLGNELKPENMLDQKASQAYLKETGDDTVPQVKMNGAARTILDFCREYNIPVRGHTLVWHSQTPTWFFKDDYTKDGEWVDKATMLKRMENYIKGVFDVVLTEYPDIDFYAWDVVNEAFGNDSGNPRDPGTYEAGRGESAWVKVFGDNSFIKPAFQYARKYAPANIKLYYNDYNEYMTAKQDGIIELVRDLAKDNLIDGIGMQSHLDIRKGSDAFPSTGTYAAGLKKYVEVAKELNLDLQVTELDATLDKGFHDDEAMEIQAKYYSDIMDTLVKYKDNISAVVFWGTTDDQSWRAWGYPLLFNEDYSKKECFDSIVDGIQYTTAASTTRVVRTTTTTTATTEKITVTTPDSSKRLAGDVNLDKSVDVSDAVLLAKFLGGDSSAKVTDQGKANGEVDGKEGLSTDDLTMILKYICKLTVLK
ncbi:MAG: endo-1,4-beta-xylanase [Oscillospiraceae bacterium]|nr:endo-1,4-beta-xylanase [Oscillospiraceae bacterium]